MWHKIDKNILQISEVAGVEIMLHADNSYIINVIVVALERSEICKKKEWINLKTIDELAGKLTSKIPMTIAFTGKSVLVKSITQRENITSYVGEIFPEANPNEFYNTVLKQQENLLVAVSRKQIIDNIIESLSAKGFKILNLSLSFFEIITLIPYLNTETKGRIDIPAYELFYNDQFHITSFATTAEKPFDFFSQKEYAIGNQYFKSPLLLPLAAASRLLADSVKSPPNVPVEKVILTRNEYTYSKYFVAASWAFLIALFSILLINFGFYNYYFNKNREFALLQTRTHEELVLLKKQEAAIRKIEAFLTESGWLKASKTSYLADRIASLISADIYLTALHLYPASTSSYFDKNKLPFKKDTIQITGNCTDPLELNQFTNNLKNLAEIKEVNVKNYLYKKENENASFQIEVITR